MPIAVSRLTVEEFFEQQSRAEWPAEYHGGEVFPLEAVTITTRGLMCRCQRC